MHTHTTIFYYIYKACVLNIKRDYVFNKFYFLVANLYTEIRWFNYQDLQSWNITVWWTVWFRNEGRVWVVHEHREIGFRSSLPIKLKKWRLRESLVVCKCNISWALRGSHSLCLGNVYLTITRQLWKRYKNPWPDKRSAFYLFFSFSSS